MSSMGSPLAYSREELQNEKNNHYCGDQRSNGKRNPESTAITPSGTIFFKYLIYMRIEK